MPHPDLSIPQTRVRPGFQPANRSAMFYLTGFQSILPRFSTSQNDLLSWLAEAHVRAGGVEQSFMEALFSRYSASADHIARRGHELEDFTHRRWDAMRLFGPKGSDLGMKTRFFEERTGEILERFYPTDSAAPEGIIHVTCTGYASPSCAQSLVSCRGWGRQTQVLHAYHMGCYAAHPAVRMGIGLGNGLPVDVVHTELCSLHLDPAQHDPSHLVIQSLFADGFIRYQIVKEEQQETGSQAGLQILAARDEIIPDSTAAMGWTTGSLHFAMNLSRDVPALLATAVPRFLRTLMDEAGLHAASEKENAVFAIHPGGPRIIDLSQKILNLSPEQVEHSRKVLQNHGNMSSATLPHIWQKILDDAAIPSGTIIVSLGAGPGLTLSGMLFRKVL